MRFSPSCTLIDQHTHRKSLEQIEQDTKGEKRLSKANPQSVSVKMKIKKTKLATINNFNLLKMKNLLILQFTFVLGKFATL